MTRVVEIENEVRALNKVMSIRMTSGIDIFDGRRVWFVKIELNTTAVSYIHTETCRPEESEEEKGRLAAMALAKAKIRYRESRGE